MAVLNGILAVCAFWMPSRITHAFFMDEITETEWPTRSEILRTALPPGLPAGAFTAYSPEGALGQTPSHPPEPTPDQNAAADVSPPALSGSDLSPHQEETPHSSRQYQAQLSHYGYASDPYMDSYTKKGLGNSNNRLQPGIIAIDPESRARYGVKNGDIVSFTLGDGTQYAGYVGDTTASGLGPRFDVYDPSGNLIVRNDGRQGTVTIERSAPKAYKGAQLDIEGPARLQEFLHSRGGR